MTLPPKMHRILGFSEGKLKHAGCEIPMDRPTRRSPRIPNYDYATPNYYFVTICTYEKQCLFGKPGNLNTYGRHVQECIQMISQINEQVRIDHFVVMPNHIHAIVVIQKDSHSTSLSTIIGQFKSAVTKRIRQTEPNKMVWQRSFHDHVIRNQKQYELIWEYIEHNPLGWERDCFYSQNN